MALFFTDTVYIQKICPVRPFVQVQNYSLYSVGVKNERDVVRSLHATQQRNSQGHSQNTET